MTRGVGRVGNEDRCGRQFKGPFEIGGRGTRVDNQGKRLEKSSKFLVEGELFEKVELGCLLLRGSR